MLYGTNEPGGVVNYVAKRPQVTPGRELALSLGSYHAKRAELDLTGALGDTLSWRLIAVVDKRDSHRDCVWSERYVFAPSLTWRPSSSTEVTVFAELLRQDYLFERGFPVEPELIALPREVSSRSRGLVIPPGFLDTVAFGNDYGSRITALYLQGQLAFGQEWKATFGVRYDRARIFRDDLVDPAASLRPQTQSKASPRAGVVCQPSEATSLFAGYSTSFNPQICSPLANGDLPRPTVGKQIDVGWRQQWLGQRLASTVSLFEIRKQNVTTADPANPQLSIQVGEQRRRGVEFELRGEPARGVELIAAAAWIDARATKDNTLPVGDRLDSAPKVSGSVWGKYQPADLGWFAGAGVFHLGKREGSLPDTGVRLPAETRVDAARLECTRLDPAAQPAQPDGRAHLRAE